TMLGPSQPARQVAKTARKQAFLTISELDSDPSEEGIAQVDRHRREDQGDRGPDDDGSLPRGRALVDEPARPAASPAARAAKDDDGVAVAVRRDEQVLREARQDAVLGQESSRGARLVEGDAALALGDLGDLARRERRRLVADDGVVG